MVWELSGDRLTIYEVTSTSCLRGTGYRRADVGPAGVIYRSDSTIGAVAADWLIRPAGSSKRLVAHSPGTAADVRLTTLSRLPAHCRRPPAATTEGVFEHFSRTMAEHYAFFREHGVDWTAATAEARPRALAAADARALYEVLSLMVAPLRDRHTDITATTLGIRHRFGRVLPDSLTLDEVRVLRAAAPSSRTVPVVGRYTSLHDGRLQFGRLEPGIGYLKVTALYGFHSGGGVGSFEADSVAFAAALDRAFRELGEVPGLVLDLRINGGGYDALAKLLAGRLSGRRYLGFTKQARNDPADPAGYTPPSRVMVEPVGPAPYQGPLAVLLGPNTFSAGEVLAMMLIGRRPRPKLIGEPTQGIFADELVRRLPNGWRFQLSNERYAMPNGDVYEGRGVPVDRPVPVHRPRDRARGRDPALEAAVSWLGVRVRSRELGIGNWE
jgi:hypothetical protein